jgi:predicted Ser/Thr protein kinase
MIGERLGKWRIFKELGRGGMGRVYLAQEEGTGRQAALKILAGELAQDIGFLQRFQREIETLSQLSHPNIVRFYESGFENDQYFYAMEYVDGQSLDEILHEQRRMPWRDTLDVILQLCPALRHVHDHGVIHRDLKPSNIIRTASGEVKLMDFGIAKIFASTHLTATGGVVGTAEFISPEQASGKPVTKRSDLYSLGVVMYTLLVGRPPFEGSNILDLLHKHRYAQFDKPLRILSDLPYEVDEVVCQLLEKDPAKRPPDCLVLYKQLDAIRRKLEKRVQNTEMLAATEPTVAEHRVAVAGQAGPPGPATLMSQLMREEIARQKRGSPLTRTLNHPAVLVLLLAACVAVIAWAFWPLDRDTLFRRGARLMDSSRLSDMNEAWREYLEPLERRFPDHPYKDEIEKFKIKLDAAKNPAPTEAQHFYQLGERLRQQGNDAGAREIWSNLATAFENSAADRDWVQRAKKALGELDEKAAHRDRLKSAQPVLDRAAALKADGKVDEAERIWTALEALYRNDAAAKELLEEIRKQRGK